MTICYRCSRCCYYLNVVVSPKYAHLDDIDFDNIKHPNDFFVTLGCDQEETVCPYLGWDKEIDRAVCRIRHKKWFVKTPCHRHNCIGDEFPTKCNIGELILKTPELFEKYKQKALDNDQVSLQNMSIIQEAISEVP